MKTHYGINNSPMMAARVRTFEESVWFLVKYHDTDWVDLHTPKSPAACVVAYVYSVSDSELRRACIAAREQQNTGG